MNVKIKILFLFFLCLLFMPHPSAAKGAHSVAVKPVDRLTFKALSFTPPQARRLVMDNGIILYFLEDHELPLVNVSVVFRTGSAYDPAGKAGLAGLTARTMRTGGAGTMTGGEIDDALAFRGISLQISAEADMSSVYLSALKEDWVKAFEVMSQMLMNPAFEEKKLQLAKDLAIEDLRGIVDDPSRYAFREFRKLLYRGDARGNLATPESIRSIQRSDLVDFHRRFLFPKNLIITITGDVSQAEAVGMIGRCLGAWWVSGQTDKIPKPDNRVNGFVYHIQKDIPQSVIISGRFGPSKKDREFYTFTVLDFILGSGGFRSRLFQEIRSNRGLAYSTGSFYRPRDDYGAFGAYALTKSASTAEVLELIQTQIRDIKENGIGKSELSWAKKSLTNSFIFSFQSVDQIALSQALIEYDTLPADFLHTYTTKISEVNTEDIRSAAGRYYDIQDFVTLVLGNENGFEKPLPGPGTAIRMEGTL
jgi:zinc protease